MRRVFIILVRLYQLTLSRYLGGMCRFEPSCSNYSIEAFRVHGTLKGLVLTAWRILRCNPFCEGGLDPVPAKGKWK